MCDIVQSVMILVAFVVICWQQRQIRRYRREQTGRCVVVRRLCYPGVA